ncbi:MAG: hypothetical protein FWD15_01540 [Alphaproteobacteria bacterium]|nr:hypothetical protein [Alphaproteobacteria bacterium]
MKFKLIYSGELKINPKKRSKHINEIRKVLSPQLKRLTEITPYSIIKEKLMKNERGVRCIGGVKYFPIITPELNLLAELDIQILHPELLETPRADIDNRLKTLMDALKRPQSSHEVCDDNKGKMMYTLLDDDHMVKGLSINTTHLLSSDYKDGTHPDDYKLLVIITVAIKASKGTPDNLAVIV